MKSANINDSENLAAGATSFSKWMERMTAMSLKRASGKPGKYGKSIRMLCPTSTLHRFGSFSGEGFMTVKPNRSLSAKIYMIWATTAMGNKIDRKMYSTQFYSYANMVVVGK